MTRYHYSPEEQAFMEKSKIPFGIYQVIDGTVVPLVLSDGFRDLFHYVSKEEAYYWMEHDLYEGVHPDDVDRIRRADNRFFAQGNEFEVVYRLKYRDHTGYHMIHEKGLRTVTDTGAELAHVWYTDEGPYVPEGDNQAPELNQLLNKALHEESILKAGAYDYLTGLLGMTSFFVLAEEGRVSMLKEGKEPVLLFFDFSGMKYFNRKYGFSGGDRLLKAFALELSELFGAEHCSRFGQDHFAVFTEETGLEARLTSFFAKCRNINGGLTLPVHVGIYLDRMQKVEIAAACDRARYACEKLKNISMSDFCYYDEKMQKEADDRQYIIDHIDRAIEEKWIKVYYQPVVRAVSGKVCDDEALARWDDPERGLLSPDEFIPILEDTRLIYKVDLYVVEQVLEKLRIQEEAGVKTVSQSINLSRADFDVCDIVEEIRRRVDAAGVPRNKIKIEITESIIGSDFDYMREQVLRFQELGFPVWMDDFGSGYSSLDVLHRIPFDLIKFDMRFMQELDGGESGKIILIELMRMATALGIDTICEGVETEEQVRFLQEIGCSMLQGYYFSRPIDLEHLLLRYERGEQIGYENILESQYYETISRINFYDPSVIAREEESLFQNYFSAMPMVVMEVRERKIRFLRSNQSYRDLAEKYFEDGSDRGTGGLETGIFEQEKEFEQAVLQCSRSGKRMTIDIRMSDQRAAHLFLRPAVTNPVTKASAVIVVVVSVWNTNQGITYANIARALATDYFNLFYVDLVTERFIEYSSDVGKEELAMERHGEDFFHASRRDALKVLYKEDQDAFIAAFTKENVLGKLEEQGTFTLTYRQMDHGRPVYVNMKAMRVFRDDRYLIIGVSNVDTQMKQREALEQIRQERIATSRIMALSGNYICIYIVDPETDQYLEFSASADYENLGLAKGGEDFFGKAQDYAKKVICPEDIPVYREQFSREKVMRDIREKGRYKLRYRLMINGEARPVSVRAALVEEADGRKLIIGVKNVIS